MNISVADICNYLYSNNSVSITRNVFVEVSESGRKFIRFVFGHDFSNKSILIGTSKVGMELPNGTSIDHWKTNPLLNGGGNLLFSRAHNCYFLMTLNNVSKHHIGKKYIHDGDHIILIKYEKSPVYAPFYEPPFQEPVHNNSGYLLCGILTVDWVYVSSLINNSFEIKLIFHNHNEVDDDHHIRSTKSTYYHFKGPFGLITIYCTKDIFNHFNQLVYYFIFMPLNR